MFFYLVDPDFHRTFGTHRTFGFIVCSKEYGLPKTLIVELQRDYLKNNANVVFVIVVIVMHIVLIDAAYVHDVLQIPVLQDSRALLASLKRQPKYRCETFKFRFIINQLEYTVIFGYNGQYL